MCDFTLLKLRHLSMSLAYKALCNARISDSKSESSIYDDITSPQCVSNVIPSCVCSRLGNIATIIMANLVI